MEGGAFFVHLGGARRDHRGAHLAQHLQQQAVVILGIGIRARRGRVLRAKGVALLFDLQHFAQVQPLQAELQIQVI